ALAAGALFGLTALVLHSIVDFGLHVPAIALLATVTAAHLVGAASPEVTPRRGVSAWIAAVALVPLAAFLVWDGWAADRAERYRLAAEFEARRIAPDAAERQVAFAAAAFAWQPANAERELALALAHLRAFDEGRGDRHLREGLRHLVAARNAGPLLPAAQVRLAAVREHFAAGDPASRYLERAYHLLPNEPQVAMALSRQYVAEGRPDHASSVPVPQTGAFWRARGQVEVESGRIAEAVT